MCSFTDSVSNMNAGEMLDHWEDAPILRSMYCTDHVLQLTAKIAYSGDLQIHGYDDYSNAVAFVKRAK